MKDTEKFSIMLKKYAIIDRKDLMICPGNHRLSRTKEHLDRIKSSVDKEGLKEEILVHWSDKDQKWHIFDGGTRFLSTNLEKFQCKIYEKVKNDCEGAKELVALRVATEEHHSIREVAKLYKEMAQKYGSFRKFLKAHGQEKYYSKLVHYYQLRNAIGDPEFTDYLDEMEKGEVQKIGIQVLGQLAKMDKLDRSKFLSQAKIGKPIKEILRDFSSVNKGIPKLVTLTKKADDYLIKRAGETDPEDFLNDVCEKMFGTKKGKKKLDELREVKKNGA